MHHSSFSFSSHHPPTTFLPPPTYPPIYLPLQASAQPFLVLGILTTALAVGHHDFSI